MLTQNPKSRIKSQEDFLPKTLKVGHPTEALIITRRETYGCEPLAEIVNKKSRSLTLQRLNQVIKVTCQKQIDISSSGTSMQLTLDMPSFHAKARLCPVFRNQEDSVVKFLLTCSRVSAYLTWHLV